MKMPLLAVFALAMLAAGAVVQAAEQPTLIVVGSGLAGLTAALEAANLGAHVTILEKEAKLGGNSAKASSGINAADTGAQRAREIKDSAADLRADTLRSGRGLAFEALVTVLADNSASAIDFLQSYNLNLTSISQCGGHSKPRTHREPDMDGKPRPVGWDIVSALIASAKENANIKVVTEAKVVRLIKGSHGGKEAIVGVAYEANGATSEIHAGAVLLATGGYSYDSEGLIKQFAPRLRGLPTTNGPWATGDGFRLGTGVMAEAIHMDQIQVHPTAFVDPKEPEARVKFLAPEAFRGSGALLLTRSGQRFVDELGLRDTVTSAMYRSCAVDSDAMRYDDLPHPSEAVMLMDEESVKLFGRNAFKFYLHTKQFFTEVKGPAGVAHYLSTLRSQHRLPPVTTETIEHVLEAYAVEAKEGLPGRFGKTVFPSSFSNATHVNGTLYVARVTPAIHYTMGGLRFDIDGHLFRTTPAGTSEIYPGLYAAGEVTGGLHGANRLAGNSLLECVVFGRRAAQSAVREQQKAGK